MHKKRKLRPVKQGISGQIIDCFFALIIKLNCNKNFVINNKVVGKISNSNRYQIYQKFKKSAFAAQLQNFSNDEILQALTLILKNFLLLGYHIMEKRMIIFQSCTTNQQKEAKTVEIRSLPG